MKSGTNSQAYSEIVAEADAAVSSVKDPALRAIAFEKILSRLLGHEKVRDSSSPTKRKGVPASKMRSPEGVREQKVQRAGLKAYVEELVDENFFKEQRTISEVQIELGNRGRHIAVTSLSGPLQTLTQERRLRRQKESAAGEGSKVTYAYSNW